MSLYNISEFLTVIKEDMGIKNIPLPVDDAELLKRMGNSALKEFSVRAPRAETILLNESDIITPNEVNAYNRRVTYRLPTHKFTGSVILGVTRIDLATPMEYSNYYIPQGLWMSPDMLLGAIGDVKIAASMASNMGKAPTFKFTKPDKLMIYNGWYNGTYEVDILLSHDISLSTIPDTAFTHLRQLCVLDLEEYLYGQLKRSDNADVGIGNIQLKIDNWENAGEKKLELLKEWDENGANLDIDSVSYF